MRNSHAPVVRGWQLTGITVFGLALAGCQDHSTSPPAAQSSAAPDAADQAVGRQAAAADSTPPNQLSMNGSSNPPSPAEPAPPESESSGDAEHSQTVFNALEGLPFHDEPMPIDDARTRSKGIRKLSGKYINLYTDIPSSPEIDALPAIFDQAVPQWCSYFQVDPQKVAGWNITGIVMRESERFDGAGLFPADLPPFLHGYHRGYEFWVYDQPSIYYLRHLVLHEGTHAFMRFWLGGTGPAWYAEGMAELLATHRWNDGKLTLRYMPTDSSQVPLWGRIRLVKDELQANKALRLDQLLNLEPDAYLQNPPYAWSWAAAYFLDHHPDFRHAFRGATGNLNVAVREFNGDFIIALQDRLPELNEQWQLFITELDYGYDVARSAVLYKPGKSLPAAGASVTVQADRGWQSTGVHLDAGTTYTVTAEGRFQLNDQPRIWWCEPNGVTIQYYRQQPLGILLGAVRNDDQPVNDGADLVRWGIIGKSRQLQPQQSGTLYVRINDSPADLANNAGTVTVRIKAN